MRHLGGFPFYNGRGDAAYKTTSQYDTSPLHPCDSTMIGIGLCILTIFHVVLSEQMPPHCRGPPPGVENPTDCCKSEKIFTEEDLKECGIEKPDKDEKHPRLPDCSKQVCLLNRYSLMKDEDTVDKEAVAAFLDEFVEKNADFKTAADTAKELCLGDHLPGPPSICEANKVVFCVAGTIFMNCPKWEDSDNCNKLKKHFEDCNKFSK